MAFAFRHKIYVSRQKLRTGGREVKILNRGKKFQYGLGTLKNENFEKNFSFSNGPPLVVIAVLNFRPDICMTSLPRYRRATKKCG